MIQNKGRSISNLTKDTYALVLAGGRGNRLFELTDWHAKSAVYFGGKFRIIDFPLSNCVNSGIQHIGIATQYKSHSLIRHINRGWGHIKANQSEFVEVLPASQRSGDYWYVGTADAVYQNLDIIRRTSPKYILILSGDHVYRMDYGTLLAQHVENNADMTICCIEVAAEKAAGSLGVMTVNSDNKITAFDGKLALPNEIQGKPGQCLASMGNYVFNSEFLFELLKKDSNKKGSSHDFGHDIIPSIIPSIIQEHNVFAFPFKNLDDKNQPYWQDLCTLDSYWQANMDLVEPEPKLDLYDTDWPIWTYQEQLPPAKFIFDNDKRRGMAVDSTISCGCIISGSTIRKSLLFSDVHTHSHSVIEKSILMHGSDIGEHCRLHRVVVDSRCKIPAGLVIGYDKEQDIANGFRISEKGVTLVTQNMLKNLAKKQLELVNIRASKQELMAG